MAVVTIIWKTYTCRWEGFEGWRDSAHAHLHVPQLCRCCTQYTCCNCARSHPQQLCTLWLTCTKSFAPFCFKSSPSCRHCYSLLLPPWLSTTSISSSLSVTICSTRPALAAQNAVATFLCFFNAVHIQPVRLEHPYQSVSLSRPIKRCTRAVYAADFVVWSVDAGLPPGSLARQEKEKTHQT